MKQKLTFWQRVAYAHWSATTMPNPPMRVLVVGQVLVVGLIFYAILLPFLSRIVEFAMEHFSPFFMEYFFHIIFALIFIVTCFLLVYLFHFIVAFFDNDEISRDLFLKITYKKK